MHVPYRAFPGKAFFGLTAIGSIDVVSLVAFSKAVMLRAATKTLNNWQDTYLALRSTAEDHLPFASVLAGCVSPGWWDSDAIVVNLHDIVSFSRRGFLYLPVAQKHPPVLLMDNLGLTLPFSLLQCHRPFAVFRSVLWSRGMRTGPSRSVCALSIGLIS